VARYTGAPNAGEATHRLAVAVATRIEKTADADGAVDAALAKVLGDAALADPERPRLVPMTDEGVRASGVEECALLMKAALRAASEGETWAVVYPLDAGGAYLVAMAAGSTRAPSPADLGARGRCSTRR
jgi:hypothetical protein